LARLARARVPALIFVLCSVVYSLTVGQLAFQTPSEGRHYAHLAASFLNLELGVVGNQPPGTNDWACYDTETHGPCPANRHSFPESERERYRWYVSFPPLPAVIMAPFIAVFGMDLPDRLIWAILAALGPALLFVLLRHLRETGKSGRTVREDLVLTTLFAFGTVYFFTAVQGTVWFAAHSVAVPLTVLFLLYALDARRPVLAGLALGLAFLTRPSTAFLAPFFLVEALRMAREGSPSEEFTSVWRKLLEWLRGVRLAPVARSVALFSAPIVLIGLLAMWMNHSRFEDPFEFGHQYLQIRWRPRIERWGLFNYHYLGKNLAVFLAALPWLTALPPYVKLSEHGLALWFTTPNLLQGLWPKRITATMVGLYLSILIVMVLNLSYQNSGWRQFGYRFALDYMVPLFAILALTRRRQGAGFIALAVFAIAINTFGALTFDRALEYYHTDLSQAVIFHPD